MSKINQIGILTLTFIFLFYVNISFAENITYVEFFSSNNTEEINMKSAYARLISGRQKQLKNTIKNIVSHHHFKNIRFENILGSYRMASNKKITSDNVEEFFIPYSQCRSDKKIFSIAKQLAENLNQESVAVFIPNDQSTVGDVTLEFISFYPTISEALALIREKLPTAYSEAFSLHFQDQGNFATARIQSIEWLGGKIKLEEVEKSFPDEHVISRRGKSYLIYKDGHLARL